MNTEPQHAVLQPTEETIALNGEQFTVCTFKAGQMAYVLPRLQTLFTAIPVDKTPAEEVEKNWLKHQMVATFKNLEALFGKPETFELMALSIKQPIEFVQELDILEAEELFTAMWKVNATYFFTKLQPILMDRALDRISALGDLERVTILRLLSQ